MRYLFESFSLDTERRELRSEADLVAIEPQVFDLLTYLIENRQRVVSKEDLLASIWKGRSISESALTTRINAARRAIADSGREQRLIKTLLRKGVRFVGVVQEEHRPRIAATIQTPAFDLALPDRPSIAVLPFQNLSGDPVQKFFADGMAEDIITELSRFSGLFVIARNSSFQWKGEPIDVRRIGQILGVHHVLEGSIRRAGDVIRVNVQLTDAQTGIHRWAERYDRTSKDVLAVQDEVARTVAAILAAHVSKAEKERALLKPPLSLQAYDFYVRAADSYSRFHRLMQVPEIYETRTLLEHCLTLDPGYARAHVLFSETKVSTHLLKLDGDHLDPTALENAHWSAERAVQLDPILPEAHLQLAYVRAVAGMPDAETPFERSLDLNPNFADRRSIIVMMILGRAERAIDVARAYLRVDPFALPIARGYLGLAYCSLKRYSEALAPLQEFVSQSPNHRPGRVWLTVAYAHAGRIEEAKAQAAHVLRLDPDFIAAETFRRACMSVVQAPSKSPTQWRGRATIWRADMVEDFVDGLRKAGLPVK